MVSLLDAPAMSDAPKQIPKADHGERDAPMRAPDKIVDDAGGQPPQKGFGFFDRFRRRAATLASWIAPLASLAGLFWGLDFLIERKLSDESVLRKIAAHSRPSLIFDAKESIIADMGAVQFINPKDIHITKRTAEGWPQRIHVGFVRAVSIPPILTSLYDSAQIRSERGKGLDWEFEISWSVEPLSKDDKDRLYRLEIIP